MRSRSPKKTAAAKAAPIPPPLAVVERAAMTPAVRRALRAGAEAAAARLAEVPAARLWAVAQGLTVRKASPRDERGRLCWAPEVALTSAIPSRVALAAALADRDPLALAAALALLARVSPEAALPLFRAALTDPIGPGKVLPHELDIEAALVHTVLDDAGAALAARLPASVVEELWARGQLLGDPHVPLEVMIGARWDSLRAALRMRPEGMSQQIYGVLAARADLTSTEARLARLAELAATVEPGEEPLVGWLADALVEAGEPAVVPVLQAAEPRMRALVPGWSAGPIVLPLGSAEAMRAVAADLPRLAQEIEFRWVYTHPPNALLAPVRATFGLDPASAVDRLAPYFTAAAVASEAGACLARDILAIGRSAPWVPPDGRAGPPLIDADPRWLDVAARLVTHPRLGGHARALLASRPLPVRAAALAAAADPLAAGRGRRGTLTVPAKPRWWDRYVAGDHEAVWAELGQLARPPTGAARAQAQAVVAETMRRVKGNLARISAVLRTHDLGRPRQAVRPPAAGCRQALAAMEALAGAPMPLALRAFHERIGSVTLGGRWWQSTLEDAQRRRVTWRLDPLVLVPVARALSRTRAYRKREIGGLPKDLRDPDVGFYLGPDPGHKTPAPRDPADEPGGSDDAPFLVFGTTGGIEGIVRQGAEVELPLSAWLRCALRNGGVLACRDGFIDPRYPAIEAGTVGDDPRAIRLLRELAATFAPF